MVRSRGRLRSNSRQRGQDLHLEASRSGGQVYFITETHERHIEALQFIQHRNEMPQVAPKAIETPTRTTLNLRRLASFSNSSSAGRRSFATEVPSPTCFSAIVHRWAWTSAALSRR
jgi:hypothetical protein